MNGYHQLTLVLLIVDFSVLHLVLAQDQSGFISLDCGLPPNESPYNESSTGLTFSSDADFIQSGKGGQIGKDWDYGFKQYNALRYFPDGIRNCYNLSVNQGINYLVRAGFAYGNYDGLSIYPRFDIYIGPNLWTSVHTFSQNDIEIIHTARSNFLQICLVKTGTTTPIISTLELRPLRNNSYSTQSGSLQLIYRRFKRSRDLRYPDDVYDRKWESCLWFDETEINTTLTLNGNSSNPFGVPKLIASSASIPENASDPLTFYLSPLNPSDKFFFYLHFAEIQDLQANETREFDIIFDGHVTNSAYSPKKLQVDTVFNTLPKICEGLSCNWELVRTQRSTLPPLLNAVEAYKVVEFPYSETYPTDVAAMMNIQTAYGLRIISWQGDPCVPVQLKWEGVECSYTDMSTPPRIISLDLRSKGLSGTIVPALQYLTELQRLDLSNNSLSGVVPEFLATMKSLMTINLSWNKLNDSVPQALHDREKKGLQLMIKGNPKLCADDSCKFKNKKIVVPVVASVARLVLIIPLLVLIFMCTKKNMRKARNQQPIKSPILTTKIRFTNPKLQAMTNNFGRVIGEGGFRTVYHGFSRSIWKVLELAVSCVIPSSAGRPNMSHADNQLDECLLYENSKNLERFKDFY